MPNIKRFTNLVDYTSVLPYASEIFGVYQPLIGWKSKRQLDRIEQGRAVERPGLLDRLGRHLAPVEGIDFNVDCAITNNRLLPADFAGPRLMAQESIVLAELASRLAELGRPPDRDGWRELLDPRRLEDLLTEKVLRPASEESISNCRNMPDRTRHLPAARAESQKAIRARIDKETVVAGALLKLAEAGRADVLEQIFYAKAGTEPKVAFETALEIAHQAVDDPFVTFDPKKDVKDVSLSPLGIVHLFRQYFFELDTFLGTPTGHVWLSPGSSVELIEVTTRRTLVEQTIEKSLEQALRSERSTTAEDEISEAVKQENRDDLKLGITSTVEQSWATGSVSATGSLNMDRTQQTAREQTHKKMRQQTEKLSTEIRESFKTSFRTVTETTDMSSKRYVLANPADRPLMNYELRRKMRQVAVQVQDIGSYLCWQTFVDEPGSALGLADLVHIAQPANLLPVPDQTEIPYPQEQLVAYKSNLVWNFGDQRQFGFVRLGLAELPVAPPGLELVREPGILPATQISASGEDFTGAWAFGARFNSAGELELGVLTSPGGLEWDERVDFVVGGTLRCRMSAAKRLEIDNANATKKLAAAETVRANDQKTKGSLLKSVKERVEVAGSIEPRPFAELREEERIVVYRRLIESLLTSTHYHYATDRTRHVLAELINTIFDIDKMLYFVAPEWWKPRAQATQHLGVQNLRSQLDDSVVAWSDSRPRPDNYLISDKSEPAPMGSSLGWLIQLDGDNLRNAFLNAPWAKAVIPVRPGKEAAAVSWLTNVAVEGADGLAADYAAPEAELQAIRDGLEFAPGAPVAIADAIRHLCQVVAAKHAESNRVRQYPATEINDDNKVSATPIEKVYEHGFYALQGGFRVDPSDPDTDPNNADRNFQIFDQWIEILPTDQIVPVEVAYDPKTGRQI